MAQPVGDEDHPTFCPFARHGCRWPGPTYTFARRFPSPRFPLQFSRRPAGSGRQLHRAFGSPACRDRLMHGARGDPVIPDWLMHSAGGDPMTPDRHMHGARDETRPRIVNCTVHGAIRWPRTGSCTVQEAIPARQPGGGSHLYEDNKMGRWQPIRRQEPKMGKPQLSPRTGRPRLCAAHAAPSSCPS